MPIYEYEPDERDCLMCEGLVGVIQSLEEAPLKLCPWCGLSVIRVISKASIQVRKMNDPESAAKRGFSTFKKVDDGKWEKVAGPDIVDDSPAPKGGELKIGEFE